MAFRSFPFTPKGSTLQTQHLKYLKQTNHTNLFTDTYLFKFWDIYALSSYIWRLKKYKLWNSDFGYQAAIKILLFGKLLFLTLFTTGNF